jgi:phosphomannomutase/phosphoglucomutase
MNPLMFREYDIRGLADKDLTDAVVRRIGQAYGTYAQDHGSRVALIGRDVRPSSERIAAALSDGIQSTGCDVIDLGLVPTPVFYFSFFAYEQNAGMMITASHNPKEFNGFKVGLGKTTIFGPEIQRFRQLAESGPFRSGAGRSSQLNPIPAYVKELQQRVHFKRGLRVVFDPGNGTAGVLLEELMKAYPIEPAFINLEPDGTFPNHLPDPTIPENMKDVIRLVHELGADLGIGYDGDGDRIGAVDDSGSIVYGDRLLALFAGEIIRRKPGAKVVFDVKCSQGLIDYINQVGGRPLMWKTGHSLIKAKMKEEGAEIAGEMSGHMFFSDGYLGYDDAIFASLRLMKIIAEADQPFSALVARIPSYYSTPEIRVDCPDELKFQVVRSLQDYFRPRYQVIDIDGARVVFPDGWGLVRASNTQPVLVLRFEARTPERLAAIRSLFYDRLKTFSAVKLPVEGTPGHKVSPLVA